MKMKRILSVFLTAILVFGCFAVTAQAQKTANIQLGETVSFSSTQKNHIAYYAFTPEVAGTYVLYDLSDGSFQTWVSVHSCEPADSAFEQSALTRGMNQAIFQAQAGVTYWLKLDCSWISGGELSNSFKMSTPAVAEGIEIGYASLQSQYVGSEGKLYLQYTPMGSAAQVSWSTSDTRVVTVEGDANGARFRLAGAGTATIFAKTKDGLIAQYQVEALDLLEMQVGDSRTVTMPASNGNYVTEEKYVRFTPAVSGSYTLSVSYDETLDIWHGLDMSLITGSGYDHSSKALHIDAVAGKTYTVCVELWGMYDQAVEYTFSLQHCVEATGLSLVADSAVGYVGSDIHVAVQWQPDNSFGKELMWSLSDESIAQITDADNHSVQLQLLSAGTVTLTAATVDGITASVDLTACVHPGQIQLVQGTNPSLQLLPNDYFDCSFTPDTTGYYRISADQKTVKLQLDAPTVVRNGERLYHLEAGKTYTGGIDNLSENLMHSVISVVLVEVPAPKTIRITQLPDQTEFLPGVLDDIWVYDLLEGMEMEVTWSDGHISTWAFDRDGTEFESYDVRWELKKINANQVDLVMKLGDATTSCQLKVKNLTVIRMELVDADVLKIVENSCGYYDEHAKSWIYSDYLLGIHSVKITFDDGSSVTARAGQTVLGKRLNCEHTQYEQPWVKGGDNSVTFSYGKLSINIPVEIIDSPVNRIQLITKPRDTFTIGDKKFFVNYGDGAYYFSPDSLKNFLDGLSFKIFYKDGKQKTVAWKDIQWIKVSGVRYPFVDGYPLGLLGELMRSYDPISQATTGQGLVEYMGASVTYDIHLVEDNPETGDVNMVMPVLMPAGALLCMGAVLTLKKKKQ